MNLTDTQKEWIGKIKDKIKSRPFKIIFKVKELQNKLYVIFHFYFDNTPDLEKVGDCGFSYNLENEKDLKVILSSI